MGLDMRPLGKPKPGKEKRFSEVFRILTNKQKQKLSFIDRLQGKKIKTQSELLEEWESIQIKSYETLKAPRVGRDKEADNWLLEQYEKTDKKVNFDQFVKDNNGYYVLELAKEIDGVPVYISFGQDINVFRGQFLRSCEPLIGRRLVAEAWQTKFSRETLDYGKRLMNAADKIAQQQKLSYLKEQRLPPESDPEALESKVHVIYSLAKWLIFYGNNGHGYEADY